MGRVANLLNLQLTEKSGMPNRYVKLILLSIGTLLIGSGCDSQPAPTAPSPVSQGSSSEGAAASTVAKETPDSMPLPTASENLPSQAGASPDSSASETEPLPTNTEGEPKTEEEQQTINIADSWVRLSKEHEIWIDMKSKKVMLAGQICLQQGALEVFACPRRTKEHESIISVNATALELHTCLIAIGADPGKPVQWAPDYQSATGPEINIDVIWSESNQEISRNAKELVRNFETKKELDRNWVFGGSQFYVNPHDGSKVYYGDSGEMICLSNFSTATLDLPVESSGSNEMLLFEANTEKLPPVGTKAYLVLTKIKENEAP